MNSANFSHSALPAGHLLLCRYRIEQVLGATQSSITYGATCEADASSVLILSYPVAQSENPLLRAFLDDVHRLMQLRHTNMAPLRDAFEHESRLYCVIETIGTMPLSFAAPEHITQEWLYPFLCSLLGALHFLHEQAPPVLHGAICPGNILIDSCGIPRLINTANPFSLRENSDYAPLEQWATAECDPCSDIYALGATCHQLLTGTPPRSFHRESTSRAYIPLASQPELQVRFSDSILSSIDRALKLDRKERWGSAAEWLDFLQLVPHTGSRPAAEQPRSLRRVAAIGAAAVLLLTGAGYLISTHRPAPQQMEEGSGTTPHTLFSAISSKDSNHLRKLITSGADVNEINQHGRTPLAHAIVTAHTLGVEALLAAPGIDANKAGPDGNTPLHHAAAHGHADYIHSLLRVQGVTPSPINAAGHTPLHMAASSGAAEAVRLLLAAPGSRINQPDPSGYTPLHLAAYAGQAGSLRALLAAPGIEVNAEQPDTGITPLALAVCEGHTHCVRELLAAHGIEPFKKDSGGCTPLHHAAYFNHPECLQTLLNHPGCDVNATDDAGCTALWQALSNGNYNCARLLLSIPGIRTDQQDALGETLLHLAARQGATEVLRALLSMPGNNPDATNHEGHTPLDLARKFNRTACIELLQPPPATDAPPPGPTPDNIPGMPDLAPPR